MTQLRKSIPNDKREFFRIYDDVNLSYRLIDEVQTKQPILVQANLLDSCSLSSALELINKEADILHEKLGKIHPDFADYLKLLDIKVNLLATTVIRIAGDEVHKNQTRNANISVSGIGFDCEELLELGQYLELKILLVHSTVVMTAYAKVIHHFEYTNPESPYPYFVGATFINMKETDSELLSTHIAKKQLQQIRQRKESQDL
jgi:hypothetical protein